MPSHTYLSIILKPLEEYIDNYNWVISDLEYYSTIHFENEYPINLNDEYFMLSTEELKIVLSKNIQIWWGVLLAVPISEKIELGNDIPYADGNTTVWKNNNFQIPNAEIEIVCFDSTCTIVKFTNKKLSDKFKSFFGEDAIPLEKFDYNKLYK